MIGPLGAHGFDPGPTERPLLVGAATGFIAALPAVGVLLVFGTLQVVADAIIRLPRATTALTLLPAFILAGVVYGGLFRRAASDYDGGWIFGLAFGFLLWVAAPVVALPLITGSAMVAGTAAIGFLVGFLVWGLTLGLLFPFVHRPLRASLEGKSRWPFDSLGPDAAISKEQSQMQRGQEQANASRAAKPWRT